MPRPKKCRKVCRLPVASEFTPCGTPFGEVMLTVDEYETLRLIDLENFSQEECGGYMDAARTTVQAVYNSARRKLADALVNGRAIRISGGDYRLCDGAEAYCRCGGCARHRAARLTESITETENNLMKIAVTYENGQIFQHFGHTEQFKIYTVEDGKITSGEVVDTNGSGHGALAGFLAAHSVDTLICGGIGGGARSALDEAGIKLYGGASGSADDAVAALLAGNLGYNPDARCDHHDHEHGHDCGEHGGHGCGGHGHGEHGHGCSHGSCGDK